MSLFVALAWAMPELWFVRPHHAVASGPTFSIASFNLNKGLKDASVAIAEMTAMDADFIVCQEVSPHVAAQLHDALNARYPHEIAYPDVGYNGVAVFSRTPIVLIDPPTDSAHRNLTVRATALGRAFILVDTHLASPQTTAKRRTQREQVTRLIDDVATSPTPTILIGDFNAGPFTPHATTLASAGFIDIHRILGGRQTTWPAPSSHSWLPRSRIDTAFVHGNAFQPIESEVGGDFGSDHHPIKVTFTLSR